MANITVAVASYRRPDALRCLVSSLRRQTLSPTAFELSVVIDGIDATEPRYRAILDEESRRSSFSIRYAFQENSGQALARHRAIASSSARWICVVDDDMDLAPGFLASHLRLLRTWGERTVVIGRVVPEDAWRTAPLYEAVRTSHMLDWHTRLQRTRVRPWGQTFVTQNVSFSRAFYMSVGGFDPALRFGEDSELGLRLELAGGRFVFGDDASAIHRSRVGSYRAWLTRCVEYGKAGVYIFEKLQASRAHPLRNLVTGSRLNAAAVHALCWSDTLARGGIATLRLSGNVLRSVGLVRPAIATHKAILAIAYHVGVKQAMGSWRRVLEAKRAFAAAPDVPREPT